MQRRSWSEEGKGGGRATVSLGGRRGPKRLAVRDKASLLLVPRCSILPGFAFLREQFIDPSHFSVLQNVFTKFDRFPVYDSLYDMCGVFHLYQVKADE